MGKPHLLMLMRLLLTWLLVVRRGFGVFQSLRPTPGLRQLPRLRLLSPTASWHRSYPHPTPSTCASCWPCVRRAWACGESRDWCAVGLSALEARERGRAVELGLG